MAQPGPSDYRTGNAPVGREHQAEGVMSEVVETAREVGSRAQGLAGELGQAIKERPYTTLAIAAGLAFAVGAVWKLGQRQPSGMEQLFAQLPEMPNRRSMANWWRQMHQ